MGIVILEFLLKRGMPNGFFLIHSVNAVITLEKKKQIKLLHQASITSVISKVSHNSYHAAPPENSAWKEVGLAKSPNVSDMLKACQEKEDEYLKWEQENANTERSISNDEQYHDFHT